MLKAGIISADEALLAGANVVATNNESKPFIEDQQPNGWIKGLDPIRSKKYSKKTTIFFRYFNVK